MLGSSPARYRLTGTPGCPCERPVLSESRPRTARLSMGIAPENTALHLMTGVARMCKLRYGRADREPCEEIVEAPARISCRRQCLAERAPRHVGLLRLKQGGVNRSLGELRVRFQMPLAAPSSVVCGVARRDRRRRSAQSSTVQARREVGMMMACQERFDQISLSLAGLCTTLVRHPGGTEFHPPSPQGVAKA